MTTTGIEALRRGILQEARRMAHQEVEGARRSSREEVEQARREAEAEVAVIVRQAEREAEALRRRISSLAEMEGKRRWLEVRERLIRQTLDRTRQQLRDEAERSSRRTALLRLLVDAARQAGGGRLEVQTSAADAPLLTPQLLEEARRLLDREGIRAQLVPAARPVDIVGGVIVTADGGRVVVDNSLEARMERQEAQLRSGIWRILSGQEERREA